MVGDKEVHNICSERKQVEPDTPESSPEIVSMSVGRIVAQLLIGYPILPYFYPII